MALLLNFMTKISSKQEKIIIALCSADTGFVIFREIFGHGFCNNS